MNILITTDDGPEAFGLVVLREAIKNVYKEAKQVVMVPSKNYSGASMAVSLRGKTESVQMVESEPNYFLVMGTPADVAMVAVCQPERVLSAGSFDMVVAGVNHGANVGYDIIHSGTVGIAMLCAKMGGMASFAFSQHLADELNPNLLNREDLNRNYQTAMRLLPEVLKQYQPVAGDCWNVNFPIKAPLGLRQTVTASYSRFRNRKDMPVHRKMEDDAQLLEAGWATVSELELSINARVMR